MLAVYCLIASVLFLQITVDKNPIVHISTDQNQTLQETEPLISKPQKETEFTGSDLSSIYYDENKSKVNKHEKSKAKSVKEYLKIAEQSLASDEKEEAVEAYNSALELKPSLYKVRTDLGDLLLSMGRITEAKASFLTAIETEENYAVAWNKLGMVYYMERDGTAAIEHFLKAVNLDKNYLEAFINLGSILKDAKNYDAAINVYMQALKLNPNHPKIFAHLGWIYFDQDNLDLAIKTMRRAIELQPTIPDVHCNLGAAYQKKGKFKEAEKAYMKGLERQPDQWCLLNNLAILKQNTGAPQKAVELYERAPKALPDYPDAHFNLANTLHQQGKFYEAAQHYKEAIRIQPSFPNIKHIGNALLDIGNKLMSSDHDKAAECFNAVLQIDPTAAIAHGQLGVIYQDKNEIEKAIESYKTALEYKPDFSDHVFAKLEHVLEMVCDWTDYDGRMKRLVGIIQKQLERHEMDLAVHALHSLVYPISHEQRKGIAIIHAERCLQKVSHLPKRNYIYPNKLSPDRRLRIGYVSSDFRDHATSHLMQSMPGLHDRKKVEVFCFSLSPDDGSRYREKFVRECEHFVDLSKIICHGEAADKINSKGIHILININGYITSARNEIFALRPAPVQAMYLAYPGTSGADYMDYIITDRVSSPLEFASQFTEKVAFMPKTFFLGDHRQMFPHMIEKVILAPESMPLENVRDNVVLLNGMDLSSVLENMNIEKVYLAASNTTSRGEPVKAFSLTVAQLSSMEPIAKMVHSNDYQTILDGVLVRNGLIVNQLNIRTGTGEEVPQEIFVTTRQQYGLPDDAIVFCNFQQLYKIHPPVLKVWAKILKRVPNSVLWVLRFPAAAEKNMIKNFQQFGISSNRIVFSKTIGKEENLRRAQLADVALDTFLYNGHTTGMDMLWAGNPVVTLPGETLASRIAASQLTTLGCPELIASSPQEYEDIAVKLGTDYKYLQSMRAKVQTQRLESPLFNMTIYTRDMERLLTRIWERHEAGKKPDHITEWNDE